MKQWYCSAACALHDGQNALKWSLYFYMSDASLMKNTHVIIAALRNSYEQLATHLGGWLQESVVFEEDDTYEKQTWSSLWVALGVLPQYVELLLQLQLRWRDGFLRVSREQQDRAGVMEDISMIVLAMLQFDNFSDSRWLGAGPSCRCLVRALLVGLESLVAFTRKDKHVSEHHISGFDKLSETSRRFVCVCSMVSYIPEAFQVEVFEDPRIPMRVDAVHSVVLEEASWLLSLPEHFWSILASSIGTPAAKLRHEAASAAMVCCAFLERRVFRAARQAPWCLCQGSIEEN